MSERKSFLEGKKILAVDDEEDVLETIEEALEVAQVDTALDFDTAVEKISGTKYDMAILDIMGVDGLKLLDKTVERGIPTVMLTAHAINAETLLTSIRKGAISFLPEEKLAEIDRLIDEILEAHTTGKPTWKIIFDELGDFFDDKFGPEWKEKDKAFWSEFSRTYHVSKGIQRRLTHDEKVLSKGI